MPRLALILGGAVCVWDDLERFRVLWPHDCVTIATNETGWLYPGRLDYWISLHPENFARKKWLMKRPAKDYRTVSHRSRKDMPIDLILEHWGAGSSGLYAVTLAEYLKAPAAVLCGVPLDDQGNVDGRPHWAMKEVNTHRQGWEKQRDRIAPWVRSMSGWTRDLLGEPTAEWLAGKEVAVR
jgi:hypothetical protein